MTNLFDDLAEVVRIRNLRIEAARLGNDGDWNDLHDEFEHASDRFFHDHAAEIERNARDAERYERIKYDTKIFENYWAEEYLPGEEIDARVDQLIGPDTDMREGGGE